MLRVVYDYDNCGFDGLENTAEVKVFRSNLLIAWKILGTHKWFYPNGLPY